MALTACTGHQTFWTLMPGSVYSFLSLSIYGFFLFFAYFVYKRAAGRTGGRLTGTALFMLAIFIASRLLLEEISNPQLFKIVWLFAFSTQILFISLWVHNVHRFILDDQIARREGYTPFQSASLMACYSVAILLIIGGAMHVQPLSASGEALLVAQWPQCSWQDFIVNPGVFPGFLTPYLVFAFVLVAASLGRAVSSAHRHILYRQDATSISPLVQRNNYILLAGATLVVFAAVFLMDYIWATKSGAPESAGHILLGASALAVGLMIARGKSFGVTRSVVADFYRSAATVGLLCFGTMGAVLLGERMEVENTTLLFLITVCVLLYGNTSRLWRLIDGILYGPAVAQQRANIRFAIEDSDDDCELTKIRTAYETWGRPTQNIFLHLGKGLTRASIAKLQSMHVATVDLHVRKIKDCIGSSKLEEVREAAHRLIVHMQTNPARK